jgi:hypothetical protein
MASQSPAGARSSRPSEKYGWILGKAKYFDTIFDMYITLGVIGVVCILAFVILKIQEKKRG